MHVFSTKYSFLFFSGSWLGCKHKCCYLRTFYGNRFYCSGYLRHNWNTDCFSRRNIENYGFYSTFQHWSSFDFTILQTDWLCSHYFWKKVWVAFFISILVLCFTLLVEGKMNSSRKSFGNHIMWLASIITGQGKMRILVLKTIHPIISIPKGILFNLVNCKFQSYQKSNLIRIIHSKSMRQNNKIHGQ